MPLFSDSQIQKLTWQPQSYWYNLTLWLTDLPNISYCVTNLVTLLKQPQFFWRSSYWTDLVFSNVTLLKQPPFSTSVVTETTILLRMSYYWTNLTFFDASVIELIWLFGPLGYWTDYTFLSHVTFKLTFRPVFGWIESHATNVAWDCIWGVYLMIRCLCIRICGDTSNWVQTRLTLLDRATRLTYSSYM
jgi:hypothetical protein